MCFRDPITCAGDQSIDRIIVARWIVVEQGKASDTRGERHLHGVLHSAVPPAGPRRVFVSRVLGVMYHQVCIREKPGVMRVLADERLGAPGGVGLGWGLVVGQITDGYAIALEPITERQSRVVEVLRD